jgi:predicted secreted protein
MLAGAAVAQKTIKLDGEDNYSSQSMTVGDKLIIKLRVDRSSGYSWQPAALEGGVLQEDAVKPRATPGTQVFEFTAAGPGVTTLTLNNVKKADPSHPSQTFAVMVGVSSLPGQAKPSYVVGRFVGPMPCADCNGIEVDLTLYAHAPNQFVDTIYKRTTRYLGKDKSVDDTGTWVLLPGTAADPSATVYAITPDGGGAQQFYWLKSVEELVPLDADKKPLTGPMDMTMQLQK